jgi:HK97 family phage major capsid protein
MDEQLLKDISARLQALGENVSDDKIRKLVKEQFDTLAADPEWKRKMRFGAEDKKLIGSKFSRWNLNTADIEFLHDIMVAEKERGKRGPSEDLANAFNAVSEAQYIPEAQIREMDKTAIDNMFPRVNKHNRAEYEAAVRAMDTAESGYGSQLIGAQYVGDMWEAARAESRVAGLIGSFEMTAPTAYLPVEVDFPAMTFVAENTDADATYLTPYATVKTGSNRVTVTAKKFVIRQAWSGEMEEDSIIPFIPFLRRQAALSLAFYQDALALNGDTTVTTGINDANLTVGATHYSGALDGIRHVGLVDNTGNKASAANTPPSLVLFKAIYGRMIDATYMHDWGHPNNPKDLVHIVDPYTADELVLIDELMTKDKAGDEASAFTGQVTKIMGHPVISSIALRKTDATGYMDTGATSNEDYGSVVTFNRNGLKWGWRRRIKIETERRPGVDQTFITSSLRLGLGRFTPTGAASGMEWADVLYYLNIGA